jgi:DNA-directed RNA polymerase subunit RPC12/RpoP
MVNHPPHLDQIIKGIDVEKEHTRHLPKDKAMMTALRIALDHLKEDTKYYDKLLAAGLEEDKSIKCKNCGHKWKASEGGKDKYVCHKCQKNNKPNSGIKEAIGLVPGSGGEGGGDNQTNSKPKGDGEQSTGNKIDTAGEFIKQLNNIRTMISNGKIKLDTKEIQSTSKILDKLANLANQSSAGPTFDRLQKYLDNLSQSLTGGNDNK